MARRQLVPAVVDEFDDAEGLGRVLAAGERHPFHCTAIADGTRTIEPGTEVLVDLALGPLGTLEALRVERREQRHPTT